MRQIIESEEFAKCVERLGGYRLIDEALDPLIDALTKNTYGFDYFENDYLKNAAAAKRVASRAPMAASRRAISSFRA